MKPISGKSGYRVFGLAAALAFMLASPAVAATYEQNFHAEWTVDVWDYYGNVAARSWTYDWTYVPFSSELGTLTKVEVELTIDVSGATVGDRFGYRTNLCDSCVGKCGFWIGIENPPVIESPSFQIHQTVTHTDPADLANWIVPCSPAAGYFYFEAATFTASHTLQANLRVVFTYEPPFVPVGIDIKPGSYPNTFNQNGHGVVPVAILGSGSLNVRNVDVASLWLQGLSVKMAGKSGRYLSHFEDINSDGYEDLVVQFEDSDAWVVPGGGTALLTGVLNDGTEIRGEDTIQIVPDLQACTLEVPPIFARSGISDWIEVRGPLALSSPPVMAAVRSTSGLENLDAFLRVTAPAQIEPLPGAVVDDLVKLHHRWPDETDIRARPWTI